MKKIVSSLLVCIMLFLMVACSNGDISTSSNQNGKSENLKGNIEDVNIVNNYDMNESVENMDTVIFGKYQQNDASGKNKEDIEWLVLEKDNENKKVLLISKYILDYKPYSADGNSYTFSWKDSDIRNWANDEFYNTAFSNKEKSYMNIYNDYSDNVIALTESDMDRLMGAQNKDGNHWYNYKRATKGTSYALNQEINGDRLYIKESDNLLINGNSGYIINGNQYLSIDYEGAIPILSGLEGFRPVIYVSYDGIKNNVNIKNKNIKEETKIETTTINNNDNKNVDNPLEKIYLGIKNKTVYEVEQESFGNKIINKIDPNTLSQEAKFDADGNLWVLQDNSALHGRDVIIYYKDGREDSYGSMWFEGGGYMEYYAEVDGQTVLKDSGTMEREHNDMVNKFNAMSDCYK